MEWSLTHPYLPPKREDKLLLSIKKTTTFRLDVKIEWLK